MQEKLLIEKKKDLIKSTAEIFYLEEKESNLIILQKNNFPIKNIQEVLDYLDKFLINLLKNDNFFKKQELINIPEIIVMLPDGVYEGSNNGCSFYKKIEYRGVQLSSCNKINSELIKINTDINICVPDHHYKIEELAKNKKLDLVNQTQLSACIQSLNFFYQKLQTLLIDEDIQTQIFNRDIDSLNLLISQKRNNINPLNLNFIKDLYTWDFDCIAPIMLNQLYANNPGFLIVNYRVLISLFYFVSIKDSTGGDTYPIRCDLYKKEEDPNYILFLICACFPTILPPFEKYDISYNKSKLFDEYESFKTENLSTNSESYQKLQFLQMIINTYFNQFKEFCEQIDKVTWQKIHNLPLFATGDENAILPSSDWLLYDGNQIQSSSNSQKIISTKNPVVEILAKKIKENKIEEKNKIEDEVNIEHLQLINFIEQNKNLTYTFKNQKFLVLPSTFKENSYVRTLIYNLGYDGFFVIRKSKDKLEKINVSLCYKHNCSYQDLFYLESLRREISKLYYKKKFIKIWQEGKDPHLIDGGLTGGTNNIGGCKMSEEEFLSLLGEAFENLKNDSGDFDTIDNNTKNEIKISNLNLDFTLQSYYTSNILKNNSNIIKYLLFKKNNLFNS